MAGREAFDQELERLLSDYQGRISRLQLEPPQGSGLKPKAAPPAAPRGGDWLDSAEARARSILARLPRLSLRRSLLLVSLALAGIFAAVLLRGARGQPQAVSSAPLPYTETAGLVLDGERLLSIDRKRQLLFAFSADRLGVRSVQHFPVAGASGLALGRDSLWSTESESGIITQHAMDWKHTIQKTYANPDRSPTAVYWDGQFLWVYQVKSEVLFQCSVGDSLVPQRQYTLPGIVPTGLYVSGGMLWTYDLHTRRLFRFRLGVLASPLDSADLDRWLPPRSLVTGFAVGPSHLYVVTDAPPELHRVELKRLAWAPHRFDSWAEGRFRR